MTAPSATTDAARATARRKPTLMVKTGIGASGAQKRKSRADAEPAAIIRSRSRERVTTGQPKVENGSSASTRARFIASARRR